MSDCSIFEEGSFLNVSSNINCAGVDCIKLIIVSQMHNSHIIIYICKVDTLPNFSPYVFICNTLYWIFILFIIFQKYSS